MKTDEYFMNHALREAERAFKEDEVPIGAVIVINDKIIARGYNQVERLNDSTAHAEIIALTSAFNFLGSKYLPEAALYVTIEPCQMCAGALYWSKIGKVVFGANDDKHGALILSLKEINLSYTNRNPNKHVATLHPKTEIVNGVCAIECGALLKNFFKAKR